jgi:hypothetical protein
MELNLTRRQIVIIGVVILLLIIIVAVLLLMNNKPVGDEVYVPQVYDAQNINGNLVTKPAEIVDNTTATILAVTRNFVARYLSYSNDNWGENIDLLDGEMTKEMMQTSQLYLASLKYEYPEDEFYGVSAKVLSQNIISEVDDNYTIEVSVQLQKTIGSIEQVDYAQYKVDLVSSDNTWLIDNFLLTE